MSENKNYLTELRKNLDDYVSRLSEIQGSFKSESKKDIHTISQSLKNILQKAEKSYVRLEAASAEEWEPLKEQAEEAFENVKESFANALSSSTEQVKAYVNGAEEFSQESIDSAAEYIKKNPFKSILLATGLGYVLGRSLR
jgi:ElaB/YqjD/DUF883 family membrane-anchored ribosome-binding protein